MVRCGNADRVDIAAREDRAEIAVNGAILASVAILDPLPGRFQDAARSTSQTATTWASGWPRKASRFFVPSPPIPIEAIVIRLLGLARSPAPRTDAGDNRRGKSRRGQQGRLLEKLPP